MSGNSKEATVNVEQHDDGDSTRDYAGAKAKSDPEEIRLVRKLDMMIMASDACIYPNENGILTTTSLSSSSCTSSTTSTAVLLPKPG
jgi:hypothetical protein